MLGVLSGDGALCVRGHQPFLTADTRVPSGLGVPRPSFLLVGVFLCVTTQLCSLPRLMARGGPGSPGRFLPQPRARGFPGALVPLSEKGLVLRGEEPSREQ